MSHQIETFPVGDRFRVAVHADLDAENPRTLSDPATGAFTHNLPTNRIEVEPGRDGGLDVSTAYPHFDEVLVDPAAATVRWARIFYNVTVVDDGRTIWWVDPKWFTENYPDMVPGTPEYVKLEQEVIAADQREYQTWADGNVYGLTIEQAVDWERKPPLPAGLVSSTMTTWEDVDALWGIYFDGDYPTRDEALKYTLEMNVDDEYRAAFSALNETSQEASA